MQPTQLAEEALAHSSQSPNRNTYLWQDVARTRAEAERAEAMSRGNDSPSAILTEACGHAIYQAI